MGAERMRDKIASGDWDGEEGGVGVGCVLGSKQGQNIAYKSVKKRCFLLS